MLWRILSAFSHNELWTNFVGLPEQEHDTKQRALMVHLPTLLRMCGLTLDAHDHAFDRRMQLAGHTTWASARGQVQIRVPRAGAS